MGKIDLAQLAELVASGEIETVTIAGVDMQGKLFGKKVPARYFLDDAKDGIHTCAINFIWDASLKYAENYEFCNLDSGLHDMLVVPDLTTLRRYPWIERTALVLGDLYNKDGSEVSIAPRNILKRQLNKASAKGYIVNAASEMEFYLYQETSDSIREKNFIDLKPLFSYPVDYSIFRLNVDDWFLSQLSRHLEGAGVPLEAIKGEYGKGQVELNVRYAEALEMADRTAVYKNGIKEIAVMNKLMATFMAKPDTDEPGSSGHTHISLWDPNGNNLFYDPAGTYGLSETGRFFLGGMLALSPAMMLFYAPYINSYKRLANGGGAPNTLTWGEDNRFTSFRTDGKGKSCRIENRIPGADVNHYLVLAAMLASGLYGIENRIDIAAPTRGEPSSNPDVERLPSNLVEAITQLDRSEIVRQLLGNEVVEHYMTAARNELNDYFAEVTDWERKKYFEFI
ncbi:glutamine synthetase family protein [Brevibacillus panacihumi]|uniref:glutamine synthetase family protein n=1 Tax=Brevibacillus panacihumi TaxID=497735 RepID=UPI003CFEDBCF